MARSDRRLLVLAVLALLGASSCAEIPTAPRVPFTLVGKIETRDGDPVSAATIHVHATSPRHELLHETTTALNGTFKILMTPGTYNLEILAPPYSGLMDVRLDNHAVGPGHPRLDYRFEGLLIEGTVVDRNGMGHAANAYFSGLVNQKYVSIGIRTFTGSFRLYVPEGTYRAEVFPLSPTNGLPSRIFEGLSVHSDTTLVFELTGRHVTGVVTGPDGAPLVDAFVSFQSDHNRSNAQTEADGSYDLYMPDGLCEIVGDPGPNDQFVQGRSFGFVNLTGDLVRDLSFAGTWWQGTVRDNTGTGVAGAYVSVSQYETGYSAWATTDSAGLFRVSVIRGSWHRVYISTDGFNSVEFGPIPAGADSALDFVMGTPSSVFPGRATAGGRKASSTLRAGRGAAE